MYWVEAAIILALIVLNGFFAGSELALVSARRSRLRARAEQGHRGAATALKLLENPTRLLSSVQVGITLVGILTGVYSGAVFAPDLAALLRRLQWLTPYEEETGFAIIVVLVTYATLIIGELVPKRIALAHAERIAELVAPPMMWVATVAAPLVWLLQVSTEGMAKLLPLKSAPQASVTEDDLRALISTGTKEGVFLRREQEMLEGVLRLADRRVESIMIPRGDTIWLDVTEPLELLWQEARTSGHARFLLCEGTLDRLIGVITLADLADALRRGQIDTESHVRPPLHVPTGISVLRLTELFREAHVHLAIVTDEYGEIEGIATPADVLKAIVGELPQTGSRERAEAFLRSDGSWLLDGHMSVYDAEKVLERRDLSSDDNYHTLAGFMLWHLGRLPAAGESLTWRGLRFEVVDMDGRRIDKVLVSPRAPPAHPDGTAAAPRG